MGHRLQRRTLCDTKRDFQLEHFIALNVPTFQQPRRLAWIITLPRNMQHLEWKTHTSVNFASKNFLAFMRCDNTKQASMEFRWNQLNSTWTTSLKMTTQTSKKTPSMSTFPWPLWACKRRHCVFNFAMSTFDNSLINKKLDLVFKGLECAAKVNLAFGFVLKNVEDGSCRYFYAHENNTLMERSKLVCTPDDITNLKEKLQKMDLVDLCTRERANTKWKFYKLTNLTVFAALLKAVPMACKDFVLPEPLLENQNVNCLTSEKNTKKPYNENLCLFRAVALHLFGNERLEDETSKTLTFSWTQLWGSRSMKVPGCSHDW